MNIDPNKLSGDTPPVPCGANGIFVSTKALFVLGGLLVLALLALWNAGRHLTEPAPSVERPRGGPSKTQLAAVPTSGQTAPVKGHPGPWGDLQYFKISIERPDEFVFVNYSTNAESRWFFENYGKEAVRELFNSVELNDAERRALQDPARWQTGTNGTFFTPGKEFILELSAKARQKVYSILADSAENHFQQDPFTFRVEEFEDWFNGSSLHPNTLALVKALLYQRGSTLCFSDLPEVFSMVPSRTERKRLVKTLSRQSTILMMLQVKPDSDVNALASYWGKGGRGKDIKPLLESLTRVSGGAFIDVVHLMPRFPRTRVYTFPYPTNDPTLARRNCFWTAMNFFNDPPDDRFCDYKEVEKAIHDDYYPIQDEPVFGDIVFLIDSRESVFHAAVYLADDKVFTKNGRNFTEPWRIMDVQDMLAEYPSNRPVRPVVYRLKKS